MKYVSRLFKESSSQITSRLSSPFISELIKHDFNIEILGFFKFLMSVNSKYFKLSTSLIFFVDKDDIWFGTVVICTKNSTTGEQSDSFVVLALVGH